MYIQLDSPTTGFTGGGFSRTYSRKRTPRRQNAVSTHCSPAYEIKAKCLPRRIVHCFTSSGRITLQRYSLASTFCSLTIVLSHDNVVAIGIKQLASSFLAASAEVHKILCIGRQIWGCRRDRNIVVVAKKDCTTVRAADARAGMCIYVNACVEVFEVGDAVLDC
jgi:hypothetical protein